MKRFVKRPINASDDRGSKRMKYVLVSFGGEGERYQRAFQAIDRASVALQLCPDTMLNAYQANKTTGSDCINGIYAPAYEELSWLAEDDGKELTRKYLGQVLDEDPQAFFHPYLDYCNIELISKSEYDKLNIDDEGWLEPDDDEYDEDWDEDYDYE